ncbi:cornichon-like protein isoform X2 [Lycorma delicatula]|uniref:cornichon-like protein isoform X2 n=1 Tax=Lycorma delicatula TaxID=130591 RepID=UPI003F51210B
MSEALILAFSLMNTGSVLFLIVYFIITLSDLECDYLNAQQCCSKLNFWILPKFIAHLALLVLFILYGFWYLAIGNLPIVLWLGYEYFRVPSGNTGVYDPTEIHNRGQLRRHMRDCMIYLGWYLLSFFVYLYCMIIAILKDEPKEYKNLAEF